MPIKISKNRKVLRNIEGSNLSTDIFFGDANRRLQIGLKHSFEERGNSMIYFISPILIFNLLPLPVLVLTPLSVEREQKAVSVDIRTDQQFLPHTFGIKATIFKKRNKNITIANRIYMNMWYLLYKI